MSILRRTAALLFCGLCFLFQTAAQTAGPSYDSILEVLKNAAVPGYQGFSMRDGKTGAVDLGRKGILVHTGQPGDLASGGTGFFRLVSEKTGEIRYVRSASFLLDSDLRMRTADGYILSESLGGEMKDAMAVTVENGPLVISYSDDCCVRKTKVPIALYGACPGESPAPGQYLAFTSVQMIDRPDVLAGWLEAPSIDMPATLRALRNALAALLGKDPASTDDMRRLALIDSLLSQPFVLDNGLNEFYADESRKSFDSAKLKAAGIAGVVSMDEWKTALATLERK